MFSTFTLTKKQKEWPSIYFGLVGSRCIAVTSLQFPSCRNAINEGRRQQLTKNLRAPGYNCARHHDALAERPLNSHGPQLYPQMVNKPMKQWHFDLYLVSIFTTAKCKSDAGNGIEPTNDGHNFKQSWKTTILTCSPSHSPISSPQKSIRLCPCQRDTLFTSYISGNPHLTRFTPFDPLEPGLRSAVKGERTGRGLFWRCFFNFRQKLLPKFCNDILRVTK